MRSARRATTSLRRNVSTTESPAARGSTARRLSSLEWELRRPAGELEPEDIHHHAGHRAAPDQLDDGEQRIGRLGQARRRIVVAGERRAAPPRSGSWRRPDRWRRSREARNSPMERPDQRHRQNELIAPPQDGQNLPESDRSPTFLRLDRAEKRRRSSPAACGWAEAKEA